MTTNSPGYLTEPERSAHSIDEIFRGSKPVCSADDLARDGVFDEGELEEFLADLTAIRRAELA
ncbi:MAG: hypothetical protein ACT4NY_11520 [Pseudonocardiales bacterium]